MDASCYLVQAWKVAAHILIITTIANCQLYCPSKCSCSSNSATCKDITFDTVPAFGDWITSITISDSRISCLTNNMFGKNVTDIRITQTSVETVEPLAFHELRSLKYVTFQGVLVDRIRSCAFSYLRSDLTLNIVDSQIGMIEAGAFSSINDGSLTFNVSFSTVSVIESNAFFDLKFDKLSFYDSKIEKLKPFAFNKVKTVLSLFLKKVIFDEVETKAFHGIEKLMWLNVDSCLFKKLGCFSVLDLLTSTPPSTMLFSYSDLVCNCSTLPLLNYSKSAPPGLRYSVQCVLADQDRVPLAKVDEAKICPNPEQFNANQDCNADVPSNPVCKETHTSTTATAATISVTQGMTSEVDALTTTGAKQGNHTDGFVTTSSSMSFPSQKCTTEPIKASSGNQGAPFTTAFLVAALSHVLLEMASVVIVGYQ